MQGGLHHNVGIQAGYMTQLSGTPQLTHKSESSPRRKWQWWIYRHVSMTSSFLMALKEECHACMDGFTTRTLLP
jgi:hypothetical protein